MRYEKPALSFRDQSKQLISRGLVADQDDLANYLSQINYYRFSGYLYPFRKSSDDDNFIPDTTLEKIRLRYEFDQDFRLLLFKAIEQLEVSIFRSQLVEYFSLRFGPFGFTERSSFKDKQLHPLTFLGDFQNFSLNLLQVGTDDFIGKYRDKYSNEHHLPFWMLAEKITFGTFSLFYGNLRREDRLELSRRFDQSAKIFSSWLHAISALRNQCAHHDRLWNRLITVRPKIPVERNSPGFHVPIKVVTSPPFIFPTVVIIQYLLNYVDPTNELGKGILELFSRYEGLPFVKIGFPKEWASVPYFGF